MDSLDRCMKHNLMKLHEANIGFLRGRALFLKDRILSYNTWNCPSMNITCTFYYIQSLFLKKHVKLSPLFLHHRQLLLHCPFRQDDLSAWLPIRCSERPLVVSEPGERREQGGCPMLLEAASTEPVCSREPAKPRVRQPLLCS